MQIIKPETGKVELDQQTYKNLKRDCEKGWLCAYCLDSLNGCPNEAMREMVQTGQNTGGPQACEFFKTAVDQELIDDLQLRLDKEIAEGDGSVQGLR